jgi:hypothetical protein
MLELMSYGLTGMAAMVVLASGFAYRDEFSLRGNPSINLTNKALGLLSQRSGERHRPWRRHKQIRGQGGFHLWGCFTAGRAGAFDVLAGTPGRVAETNRFVSVWGSGRISVLLVV